MRFPSLLVLPELPLLLLGISHSRDPFTTIVVLVLVSLLVCLVFLGVLAWLILWVVHLPPSRPAGPEMRRRFEEIARDRRFQRLAELTEEEEVSLLITLAEADYRYCSFYSPGWAGLVDGRIVLGLPRRLLPIVPQAMIAHELFHLTRHIRGLTPFREENYPFRKRWAEERVVWWLTYRYAPFRCLPFGIAALGIFTAILLLAKAGFETLLNLLLP